MHLTSTAHNRPAVAMIELIFSIAVMGIVMMAAPSLISTSVKSTGVVLQQEGINEAVSRVNMVLTYPWDQNDTNVSCVPPILHVTDGDPVFEEVNGTSRRTGIDGNSTSRSFSCQNVELNASSALGKEDTQLDDMDDFISSGNALDLITSTATGGVDYIEKETVNIATNLAYIVDKIQYNSSQKKFVYVPGAPLGHGKSSNIKSIEVVLTSTTAADIILAKKITLKAFSCNIGATKYEWRQF